MQEECEFRLDYKFSKLLFADDEGDLLGGSEFYEPSVLKVRVSTSDPRYFEIGKLQKRIRAEFGERLYSGWRYYRKYTREEISSAVLFYLNITARFEPTGEECGTVYDESTGCSFCHGGELQVSDLYLDCKRIPKTREICSTLADEWLISERLAEVFTQEKISGVELRPVRDHKKKGDCKWYQIGVRPTVTLSPRTIAGYKPFEVDCLDDVWFGKCKLRGPGHAHGNSLLSEVFVERSTWNGQDICCTKELIGAWGGLFRPHPVLLISPRLRSLLLKEKVKKFETEVAHLV